MRDLFPSCSVRTYTDLPQSHPSLKLAAPVVGTPDSLATDILSVAAEVGGALGDHLAQTLRDVLTWLNAAPAARADVFAQREPTGLCADGSRGLAGALLPFQAMVAEPDAASAHRLAESASSVAAWAEERDLRHTAMVWAEVAALLLPHSPAAALRVGKLARKAADYRRAEPWLRAARGRARRAGDWRVYCLSIASLANLHAYRGNYRRAKAGHRRCIAVARWAGLREIQGQSMHDLFGIALDLGEIEEAKRHARAAWEIIGPHSDARLSFAHAVAYLLIQDGQPELALSILEALRPHFPKPGDQVLVWGSIARAAGSCGRVDAYEGARIAVWDIVAEYAEGHHHGWAMLHLAHGAYALRAWADAKAALSAALEVGRLRAQGKVMLDAEQLLDATVAAMEPGARLLPKSVRRVDTAMRRFTSELVASLR